MNMKRFCTILLFLLITTSSAMAYSIKVYDQWGNRIGTYRKEGENFVLYDFYEKKIENPQDLILHAPSQKSLKLYSEYFYDGYMNPIGEYAYGLWPQAGMYYPNRRMMPNYMFRRNGASIVRQRANKNNLLDSQQTNSSFMQNSNNTLYESRYPYNSVIKH